MLTSLTLLSEPGLIGPGRVGRPWHPARSAYYSVLPQEILQG